MASQRKSNNYYTISKIFYKLMLGGAIYVAATIDKSTIMF
jgi:hypothetical protein